MRNILVTGGAGFVGSALIKELVKDSNNNVYSLDNYFTGTEKNHVEGATYISGETQHIHDLIRNGSEIDIVYHFGEYSRVSTSFEDRDVVWNSNMLGTYQVLRFCLENNCKLIYSASSTKFGDEGKNVFQSPYALYKAHNADLINCYSEWFGLDSVICYFYNVYGPGQITQGKYATVIGIFERQYQTEEPLTVVFPGTQERSFTHIDDVVKGLLLLAKTSGDGYCIGTEESYQIIEVAKMFTQNIVYLDERKGERYSSSIDLEKMRSLGWAPKIKLPDYIAGIIKGD